MNNAVGEARPLPASRAALLVLGSKGGFYGARQFQGLAEGVGHEPLRPGARFKASDLVGRYIAYAALLVLVVFFGAMAPNLFLTRNNFEVILQNSAVQCVVAIGMTFVILIGSIDLSVGSTMALVGTLAALASNHIGGAHLPDAVVRGRDRPRQCGGLRLWAHPVLRGDARHVVGRAGAGADHRPGVAGAVPFNGLFSDVGIPPVPFYIVVVLALVPPSFSPRRRSGATPSPSAATRRRRAPSAAGNRVKIIVFAMSGALAGLGGGILTAQIGSGSPTMGTGFELTAISAVVIGGTALTGGRGSILGTIVGSLVMSTLPNGLIILGVETDVQIVLTGVVLVGAVLLSIQRGKIRIMK